MTKKTLINMSLLPLILILVIILGAGYFLLQGDIKFPKLDRGPEIRRLQGFPTVVNTDQDLERKRVVIKSNDELNNFLNSIDKTGLLTLKDKIDFNKEYLIGVSSATEVVGDHKIKVKKITQKETTKEISILIEETFPGKTCVQENSMNIAVDLVAITKTDVKIGFDRIKTVKDCEVKEEEDTDTTNSPSTPGESNN